jgi:hypothetical protein
MKKINAIYTFDDKKVVTSVLANIGSDNYTADASHANFGLLLEDIKNDDADAFVKHYDIRKAFEDYTIGNVTIKGGEVWYGENRLGGVVVDRIFDFMANGLPVDPILSFVNKLYLNPSSRAVNELYKFLEHKNLPITPDGNFRAYKGLNGDFYSCTAGKLTLVQGKANNKGQIFNGVGETIECVRHQVDDNKDNTCSYGLHAGSLEYARDFAQGKLVIVEINPADVVSIPSDCNGQKLRTCKYVVVEEYVAPLNSTYTEASSDFNGNTVGKTYTEDDIESDGTCDDKPNYHNKRDASGKFCKADSTCGCQHDDEDYNAGYDVGYDDAEHNEPRSDVTDCSEAYQKGYRDGYVDGVRDNA